MSSASPAQQQAQTLMGQYQNLNSQMQAQNTNVGNRFNNYQDAFSYPQMMAQLDQLTQSQTDQLNKQSNTDIASGSSAAAARLASEGITGGSIQNNAINQIRNNANLNKYNALAKIGIGRQSRNVGLMNTANSNKFNETGAAQNVDMSNMNNLFKKYGFLGNNLNSQESNIGNYSKTNTFDDIFAGLDSAGQLLNPFSGLIGGGKKGAS